MKGHRPVEEAELRHCAVPACGFGPGSTNGPVVGLLIGRPAWLDIAITYGLLNVISTLAILKFFRHGDLAYDVMQTVLDIVGWALILPGTADRPKSCRKVSKKLASLVGEGKVQ